MYLPRAHAWSGESSMWDHIDQHPLGAWVCTTNEGLIANHIPFVLDRETGVQGRLLGHVSKANSVWQALEKGASCVVMFMGPQAYITPAWYPGKQAHGKVVPTWNYLTVHVHGIAQARHQADWKLKMLQRLTDAQEASRPTPWQVSDAPSEYLHRLLGGIVGIEISIEQVQGKRKLSQDEDLADRLGTVCGLMHEGDCVAQTLAAWMKSSLGGGNNSLC